MEFEQHLSLGLASFVRIAIRIKMFFLVSCCLIMACTFLAVVIVRYGFNGDLFAYEEWLLIICFWLYFLGGAVGTYREVHINADVLSFVLKSPVAFYRREAIVKTLELIISMFVIYWAVLMLIEEFASYPFWQTTTALRIPFVTARIAILFGFVFMAFYTALQLFVVLKIGRSKWITEITNKPIRSEDTQ